MTEENSPRLGIIDMPAEEYFNPETPGITRSDLEIIRNRTPAHYVAKQQEGATEPTPAMRFGNLVHCAALEPDLFEARYTIKPDNCPNRPTDRQRNAAKPSPATLEAIAWWDEWDATANGKEIISYDDFLLAARMAESVRAHPSAAGLLDGARNEVTAQWRDPEHGFLARCRTDIFQPGMRVLADLKTTTDASPEAFAKSCVNFGYHRQNAFYVDGFEAAGEPIDLFAFIAIEKDPPHATAVYVLEPEAIELGREQIAEARAKYAHCLATGSWPGYPTQPLQLQLPAWAYYQKQTN